MQTDKFQTRDRIFNHSFPKPDGYWICGIDIGYGGIKGVAPNKAFSISSYLYKVERGAADNRMAGVRPTDIVYRDKDGDWAVGDLAYDFEDPRSPRTLDTEKTAKENRYLDKEYKIYFSVALGLALMSNGDSGWTDERIMVQTGLPTKYLKLGHAKLLRAGVQGKYDFSLKVGANDYVHFEFELTDQQLFIVAQPQGAFYSACKDVNGNFTPLSKEYMSQYTFAFDPGFLTTDFNSFNNGVPLNDESDSIELGMHEVFNRAIAEINCKENVQVTIVEFRKALGDGKLEVYDYIKGGYTDIDIAPYLESANKSVCDEVLTKLMTSFRGFSAHKYFLVAGGTGAAWMPYITEKLKNLKLTIVRCNQNDTKLSSVFSTSRGYYFWLLDKIINSLR